VCGIFAGFYIDRGHRWEENQHFIQVFKRELVVDSFGLWTVRRSAVQRTMLSHPAAKSMAQPGYGLSHIPTHDADKAQDGLRSTIGMGHSSQNQA